MPTSAGVMRPRRLRRKAASSVRRSDAVAVTCPPSCGGMTGVLCLPVLSIRSVTDPSSPGPGPRARCCQHQYQGALTTRTRAAAGSTAWPRSRSTHPRPVRRSRLGRLLTIILVGQFMAVLDVFGRQRRRPDHPYRPPRVRRRPAARHRRLHHRLRHAAHHRGAPRRHHRAPGRLPRRPGALHRGLAACGLAGSTGLLIAFRFVQGAGAALMVPQVHEPHPAQLHRPGAGPRVQRVRGGARRRRGRRPGRRRRSGQRRPVRHRLAAGVPGERPDRAGAARRRPRLAARRPRRARPRGWTCRGWSPLGGRAAVRRAARARARGGLAGVGLGDARRRASSSSRCSRSCSAGRPHR